MNTVSSSPWRPDWFVRMALAGILLAGLLAVSPAATAQAPTFRNPLNNSGPDPWMTYYNGNYYLAATTWGGPSVGLTMRRASTLAGLKTATAVRIWQDSTASRCCNYWAPEFHLINGPNGLRWYGYFTGGASGTNYTVTQHIHVIESAGTDPMGPYTYRGQLVSRAALDGSVVTINGTMYAIYSVWNTTQDVAIKQMSSPWTTTGNEAVITTPTLSWERQDGNVNEGPVALQRNGRTFIIYSASACWGPNYKLGMLTLTGSNPLSAGSWTKNPNPVFQRSDANGVFAPGHNTFFKSPDGTEDWIVYHANSSSGGGCDMNRTPRIQRFTWNADGSPNFGIPVSTTTDLTVPSGESGGPTPTPTRTPTQTSTGVPPPTSTPTRTPTPSSGSTVYQAEAASFGGGATADSNNAGFNGAGFVNFPASGGFLQFNNVEGGSGGSVTLQFRYALGAGASRTGLLVVNGASQSVTFNPTGAWTTWAVQNVNVSLNGGTGNTVRIESNGQDLANIDQLAVSAGTGPTPSATPTRANTPISPTPSGTPTRTPTQSSGSQVIQAEDASVGGGSTVESNNAGFNGAGFVNFPASGGFVEYQNVDGGSGGSVTLQFRFALGATSARTGQLAVNGASQNITFQPTGAWTTWATLNVTVTLNPGASNTIRLQSTGQDLANQDQLTVN